MSYVPSELSVDVVPSPPLRKQWTLVDKTNRDYQSVASRRLLLGSDLFPDHNHARIHSC